MDLLVIDRTEIMVNLRIDLSISWKWMHKYRISFHIFQYLLVNNKVLFRLLIIIKTVSKAPCRDLLHVKNIDLLHKFFKWWSIPNFE